MEFEYYKRGAGELNTSNFPEIYRNGAVDIERLDSRAFMSLMALNEFCAEKDGHMFRENTTINVFVHGYVDHLRADKDIFNPASLYQKLKYLNIICLSPQHESTSKVKSATITKGDIIGDLHHCNMSPWFTNFVGADSSVHKFFPDVDWQASKVREDGKVKSVEIPKKPAFTVRRLIIVDDILGGGATVDMLLDALDEAGYKGETYLWFAYNEGIYKKELLDRVDGYYLGKEV